MACTIGWPTGTYDRLRGFSADYVWFFEPGPAPCSYGTRELHVAVQFEGTSARFRAGLYTRIAGTGYPYDLLGQSGAFTAVVTGVPYWFTLRLDNFVSVAKDQRIFIAIHCEYDNDNSRVQAVQYTETVETPLVHWIGQWRTFENGFEDPLTAISSEGTIGAGYGYIQGYTNPTAIAASHPVIVD